MNSQDVVGIVVSKNGISVKLTHKQWAHILESHDYMAGNLDLVFESLEDPDFIVEGFGRMN